jgi:drug/metabolite transporter (DMT)-like permease
MQDWRALRFLAVSVTLFGGVWPITKDALLQGASPLWFALSRAGLAALAAALLLALLGRLRLPEARDWPSLAAIGLLQLGGFFALSHLALALVPAGRTAILANVTIFWLTPLSVLLLHEAVPPLRWLASGVGLAGALVLMAPWTMGGAGSWDLLLGYGLLLAASLAWSLAIIVTRLWPPQSSILALLPWCFGLGALILLPLALWREPLGGIGPGAWWHALLVGGFVAPVGTWAVIEAGRKLPGSVVSVGFLLAPAIGVLLSALWLGEALGWDMVAGGALIAASVWLATRG